GESKAGGGTSPATARAESGFVTVVDGALFIGSGPPELGVVRMQAGPVMSAMQARPVRSAMRAGPVMSAMQAGPVMSAGQVIPDDLIVQSSLCVGIDCVNNEVFRFDTVRLKENNLRIHFDDTSASAGFASTDWLLVANESASGGANKFSIEDLTSATVPFTVLGGAPTNSLFVGESGDIGV